MKDYHFKISIRESAEIIFSAMTNPVTLELWTGFPADMNTAEGSEFAMWGGDITGKILKVEHGKTLVQQWYFDQPEEPSIVTILLSEENSKTLVDLTHTNIPDEAYENISIGWRDYYFKPLKKFLE